VTNFIIGVTESLTEVAGHVACMHARHEKCVTQSGAGGKHRDDFTRHSQQYHLQIYYSEL